MPASARYSSRHADKQRIKAARKEVKRGLKQARKRPSAEPDAKGVRDARADLDARATMFERLAEVTPYLGVTIPEGEFVVSTSDVHIGRGLFAKRQRPEIGVLHRSVTVVEELLGADAIADRIFVDVGANIGTSTVAAMVSHAFGSAVAVEPDFENFRILQANLALNAIEDRVTSLRVAASSHAGSATFVSVAGAGGNGWIALDPAMIDAEHANRAETAAVLGVSLEELPELTTTEVELTTLDQLVADGVIDPRRIGMLWVDVESHEGHVLGGARTLVEVGVPTVFEFHPAGLAERGDTGRILQVADACYTHFVDVRRPAPKRGHPGLRLQPVAELSGYADRFLSESAEGVFSDLLLLRLTPSQVVAGTKLRKAVARRRDAQRRQAS